MRKASVVPVAACLLGLAMGSVGLMGGCGGGDKQSGTMVPVDLDKEKAQQKEMSKFYGAAPKKPAGR